MPVREEVGSVQAENDTPHPPNNVSSPPEISTVLQIGDGQHWVPALLKNCAYRTPKEPEALLARQATCDSQVKREAKIAALKRAVEDGTYDVSADQVAEKLLHDTLSDLLS